MTAAATPALGRRVRIRVEGTVQGVGFRPYVYRLARSLALGGFVYNDARGVVVEAEGTTAALDELVERLPAEAPPLARVARLQVESVAALGEHDFGIRPSPGGGHARAAVTPDSATCPDCLRELFDPADRRYRYPFLNCTNCGPRFTIVRGVPYDRPLTAMAGFEMCDDCRAEYEDPADRRFHAQPNACPACGPSLRCMTPDGRELPGDPLAHAVAALGAGAVVAVKGLGGYHLACLAASTEAVATLRARKHREEKPFALMAPDVEAARALVDLDALALDLLTSPARPIVLAPRRARAPVAPAVAPHSRELGVMLPYSPLHHLLLHDCGEPLVLTSGNVSDEPIAFEDDDAVRRLAPIYDLILTHDRPIETRTDDSVVRTFALGRRARPMVVRRSRGHVPDALRLAVPAPRPLLACGAQLKNTFCLARADQAWVGHHIGDLENWETLRSFTLGIEHFERLFAVAPELIAHDLHPDYLSTAYALDRSGVDVLGVQHHHAHLAACLAEHGEAGPAVGAIFDGSGYGSDGTIWGGELLVGDLCRFERAGHLLTVPLPGGAAAIREPWRMACAWLATAAGEVPELPPALARDVGRDAWRRVARLSLTGAAAPRTSSAGRLFDAVAAICGVRACVTYEGQAAIELEAAADPHARGAYPLHVGAGLVLDPRDTLAAVTADLGRGTPASVVASRFHNALADATAAACARISSERGLDTVVLSGGVFQNRRLLERCARRLERTGLRVLVPERLPFGDGGISFGQAAVAAATDSEAQRVRA